MSNMERNKGKLIPVAKEVIEKEFPNIFWDDLEWETDSKYVRIGDRYYHVLWEVQAETDFPMFCDVSESTDGYIISFHTYHYNGGAHWTELVEEELSK